MLDSGASISCITLSMYKHSGLNKEFPISDSDIKCAETVDGTSMPIIGKICVPLSICRLTLMQTFYVFKKLNQSVILGRDFLKDQKAWVDFGKDVLQIQGGLVETQMFSNPRKSGLVRLVNRISIPPQSCCIAKARVKSLNLDGLALVEPIRTLPNKSQVIGARAITEVKKGQTCIQVLNPTNDWIHLKQYEPIARIDRIDKSSVVQDFDKSESLNESRENADAFNDQKYVEIAKSIGIDLSESCLSEDQKFKLLKLIGQNRDVFATCTAELGHTNIYPHRIETGFYQLGGLNIE